MKCPKCKSYGVNTLSFKQYRCNTCGFKFTTLAMFQRISSNDGFTYVGFDYEDEVRRDYSEDIFDGGSGGGGGADRSWDSGSSFDSGGSDD